MGVLHLGYHYLHEPGETLRSGLSLETSRFRNQMQWLKDHGFEVWDCTRFGVAIRAGGPLPPRLATLSFDDGLRDFYTRAWPILKKFSFPATLFIITSTLSGKVPPVIAFQYLILKLGAERLEREILPELLAGTVYGRMLDPVAFDIGQWYANEFPEVRRIKCVFNQAVPQGLRVDLVGEMFRRYLGEGAEQAVNRDYFIQKDELREMVAAGVDVGAHTVTHPSLLTSGAAEIGAEVREARETLGNVTGRSISAFGYTYGGTFSSRVKDVIAQCCVAAWNFRSTDAPRLLSSAGPWDPFDIPRFDGVRADMDSLDLTVV